MTEKLLQYLESHYAPQDYPVIRAQYNDFQGRRPFAGLRILEATPLFFNTIAKFLPLVAGGAEVTLSHIGGVPYDPAFIGWAEARGIRIATNKEEGFDLVSDCIGLHSDLRPKYGFAELTHSGIGYYADCDKPCFNTDGSRIKRIEGALGTGDGLIRGLQAFWGWNRPSVGCCSVSERSAAVWACGSGRRAFRSKWSRPLRCAGGWRTLRWGISPSWIWKILMRSWRRFAVRRIS